MTGPVAKKPSIPLPGVTDVRSQEVKAPKPEQSEASAAAVWKPKESKAAADGMTDEEINRHQITVDRTALVVYGASAVALGASIAAGAVAAPVAGTLFTASVVLNAASGAIDGLNAAVDVYQAVKAGEGDEHLAENLQKAIAPGAEYLEKAAVGYFHRLTGDEEQAAADFKEAYKKKDESERFITANKAFAEEFIPGMERANGAISTLGLLGPTWAKSVAAFDAMDWPICYQWIKEWMGDGEPTKPELDAVLDKLFPNNLDSKALQRATHDIERIDALPVAEVKARLESAEQALAELEKKDLSTNQALKPVFEKFRGFVEDLRDEYHSRDALALEFKEVFAKNPHAEALVVATRDVDRAWQLPIEDLKKNIAAADAALEQLKAVKFEPDRQDATDGLLKGYLKKVDTMRDALESRTNAFMMRARARTPLR